MPKSSPPNLAPKFAEIDREIVAGRAARVQEKVSALVRLVKSRADRLALARLARRCGLPEISQRLLGPIVRGFGRKTYADVTPSEKAEYAIALRGLGAVEEAIALLETVQDSGDPEPTFLLALSHFSHWNYRAAIPLLQKYLGHPAVGAYQRLVAETNLASALIHEGDLREAEKVLREVEQHAQAGNFDYVLGKTLYFRAELEILAKNPDGAIRHLNTSRRYLAESSPIDRLLHRFWLAVADHQKEKSPSSRRELASVRAEAQALNAPELVRNVDLQLGWLDRDATLFRKVYFGTPSESFRQRMTTLWPRGVENPDEYEWEITAGDSPRHLTATAQQKIFKVGTVPQRLFRALHSDFYRPLRIAELHSRIYPGEFYEPVSAPMRVKQALKILRQTLKDAKLPLIVAEFDGKYTLQSSKPFLLGLSSHAPQNREDEILRRLHEHFPAGFSAREAADRIGEPLRSLQRTLESAVKEKQLERTGRSSRIRYAFARKASLAR